MSKLFRQLRVVLASLGDDLSTADWYSEGWLEEVLKKIPLSFDQACERWRGLYQAALEQFQTQNKVIADAARPPAEKKRARRLRNEADTQRVN